MAISVKVRKGDLEGAIRAFNNKVKKERILEEFKNRQEYIKPSAKKREQKKRNIRNSLREERLNEK